MTVFPAFVATPQIRWSDLDLLGHVNNARIVTLIEQARIDWLNTMRDRESIAAPKLVARVELNYRTPVLYGPELQVQLGIGRVGGSSFTITCRGIQDETVVFDGLNVMVILDRETQRPTRIPDVDREFLSQFGTFDPAHVMDVSAAPLAAAAG
ncbi:MAG: acyl-CoA thioesterase [Brevibacterium yomogidense]|uniref:acyl-CoA thioesterase n=1 Tax=Brevibacterium sp. Mu109 TaxID=1255669 RepID=UPI000C5A8EED|nr:thioesterase family protein [Brevibacterium sp. Mu109]SMX83560.1 acyl-CoA thioester hydrolase [Brevibacterium sp. Mu109]